MELSAGWAEIVASVMSILCSGMGVIIWHLFQSVRADAKAAKANADALKDQFREDNEALKDELSNYKLYVAEHYVTQNELTKAVGNLEKSIERLIDAVRQAAQEAREDFTQLHRRIDEKADKRPS